MDGQISMMDNLKKGAQLVGEAEDILSGGFSFNKMGEARELFAGATSFFHGLKHMGEQEEEGLQEGAWYISCSFGSRRVTHLASRRIRWPIWVRE
jgi:hypothetical protein